LGHISSEKMKTLVSQYKIRYKKIDCNNDSSDCNKNKEFPDCRNEIVDKNSVFNKIKSIQYDCRICPLAKQAKLKYAISSSKSENIFDLIHIDIWGKFPIMTHDGFNYFLTIVEDLSRGTWIYLIKNKSMAIKCIEKFYKMVKTQFKTKIKTIRSDNGGEFTSNNFKKND